MILPAPQPEEVVVQMSHKEVPYQMEEMEEEQVQMKTILKKMKKKNVEGVASGATIKLKETAEEAEDVEEQFQIGLKPKRKQKVQIKTDDVEEDLSISLKFPAKKSGAVEEASDSHSLLSTTDSERSVNQQISDSGVVSITDVVVQPKKKKKTAYLRTENVEDAFAVQARKTKE